MMMKDEVHDKQIAYLLDIIRQLYEENRQNEEQIAYLMNGINKLSGGNVRQNNLEISDIGKLFRDYLRGSA